MRNLTLVSMVLFIFIGELSYGQTKKDLEEKFQNFTHRQINYQGIQINYKAISSILGKTSYLRKMYGTLNGYMKEVGTIETPHILEIGSKKLQPGKYSLGVLLNERGLYNLQIGMTSGKRKKIYSSSFTSSGRLSPTEDFNLDFIPKHNKPNQFKLYIAFGEKKAWSSYFQIEYKPFARVTQEAARFWFPIHSKKSTWSWNLPQTTENSQEYLWSFRLPLGKDVYEVSIAKFKFANASPKRGTFPQFIQTTQLNVWKNNQMVSEITSLSKKITPQGVEILLKDTDVLSKILKYHPSPLTFITVEKSFNRSTQKAQIFYKTKVLKDVPTSKSSASAKISSSEAIFWFPTNRFKKVWTWNRLSSIDNAIEYSWSVQIPLRENYSVTVAKIKFPRASESKGSLSDLLRTGQVNVWKNYQMISEITSISASVVRGGIKIRLTDADFLAKILKARPSTLTFKIGGMAQDKSSMNVKVQYK